jgi:hypothetical protein
MVAPWATVAGSGGDVEECSGGGSSRGRPGAEKGRQESRRRRRGATRVEAGCGELLFRGGDRQWGTLGGRITCCM